MKSKSVTHTAMLQLVLQSGVLLSAASAFWGTLCAIALPRTPKAGFAMGNRYGRAFGTEIRSMLMAGAANSFDPGGLTRAS